MCGCGHFWALSATFGRTICCYRPRLPAAPLPPHFFQPHTRQDSRLTGSSQPGMTWNQSNSSDRSSRMPTSGGGMGRASVLVLTALGAFAAGCTSPAHTAARIENAIVFQPRAYPDGDWSPDPRIEDAWIDSTDGVRLHGWFAEPVANPPRAVVLFTHGNGGNVTSRRHVIQLFRDRMNAAVLVFDYRGYGRSGGSPTEAGVLDDARAARRWLAARTGVREGDIVLVGHSLGGGVAVDLAAADGARGLVLEGTFTNLPDVAASHVPLLPVRAVMQTRLDSVAR